MYFDSAILSEFPYFGSNKFELRRCWSNDARAALFTISFKGNWPDLASSRRAKLLVKLASFCLLLNRKKTKKILKVLPWMQREIKLVLHWVMSRFLYWKTEIMARVAL